MNPIMIQAASTDAGKTTIVTGLCRLFANRGVRVAPFKSQNMALNSFVTRDGGEIARSIAFQADAARTPANIHMNPLLLKPKSADTSQLIVHGKAWGDVTAHDYFLSNQLQDMKFEAIGTSIAYLRENYELIIAEGAGSCAEPNLRALDVVNMGLASLLGAQVYVLVDIAKGGAFSDILGTLEVIRLSEHPEDIDRIEGFIINKFLGDRAILQPGIDFAERNSGKRIVGTLPYLPDLHLEEEDRVREFRPENPEIDIAIIYLPHISNANDFDFLGEEKNVRVRYARSADTLGAPDAIILPGTKNTTWDLEYIRRIGIEPAIRHFAETTPIIGICGGYQMLGRYIHDPQKLESEMGSIPGIGLLDVEFAFEPRKTLAQRTYTPTADNFLANAGQVEGYEIHAGNVTYQGARPAFVYDGGVDGALSPHGQILGTLIHDLFANPAATRSFINMLREAKGMPLLTECLPSGRQRSEESYEQLASLLADKLGF